MHLFVCFIQILCTRSNAEIQMINAAYLQLYGKSLEEAIKDEVSGEYERLLVILLNVSRVFNFSFLQRL